jgi:hypothetical protein
MTLFIKLDIQTITTERASFILEYWVWDIGRLGGVVVSVLATVPKGSGFKTRQRIWIFKVDKNPQHTFLSDGK